MKLTDFITELTLSCKLLKTKHFHAADRKKRFQFFLGVPVIVISVFLGSALFTQHLEDDVGTIAGSILAFISALLVSMQTFMNPKESENSHRSIANRYVAISRKCSVLTAKINEELVSEKESYQIYESILDEYLLINKDAESLSVTKNDIKAATEKYKNA